MAGFECCSRDARTIRACARHRIGLADSARHCLSTVRSESGYHTTWQYDERRTYRTEFDDGNTYGAEESPRPVLVLQWYPTRDGHGDPMAHGDYLSVATVDRRLRDYADAMRAYARTMFAHYVMDKSEDELCAAECAEMTKALEEPTQCFRDAEPAHGPFPLIIYHGGLGSSFEDNAALCAFLASHGFVVLGSAFPDAEGRSLNIDGWDGSASDVEFLVEWARAASFVDVRRIGLIGHSAGAQAMLRIAASAESPCDALVLIDTTQDYFSLTVPFFAPLVRQVVEGVAALTAPLLAVAGPAAIFALCDTLVNAERTYLTVPGLGHDEFIAQGHQRLARMVRSPGATPANADAADVAHGQYRIVCGRVLQFFEATLRDDHAAAVALAETDPWDFVNSCVVRVPRGVTSPKAYDTGSQIPPTPRQFVRMLEIPGVEHACRALKRAAISAPDSPICTSAALAGSLLHQLFDEGRDDEARRYYDTLKGVSLDVVGWFVDQAEDQEGALAGDFLDVAHRLEPDNADIAAQLRSS